jgi:prophage tail gpP-like protein
MNLKINHRLGVVNVKLFSSFKLDMRFDTVASTFAVNFFFDPENREYAELACVSHYHECIFEHEGERLLTGYILSQDMKDSAVPELSQLGGYSKAGFIEDCNIPTKLYPLQTDGLTIREIAAKIFAEFKINFYVDDAVAEIMDTKIEVTTADVTQTIKSYLTELCRQRNIVISHTVYGDILFTRARADMQPIFHVQQGIIATDIKMSFNGQALHSHITVLMDAESEDGSNGGEYTIVNPYVPHVYRPKVITISSGDDITLEQAARNALAAELKNVRVTINVDRWKVNGKTIVPNRVITVISPKCYIYEKTAFFIEGVSLSGDPEKQTGVLTCVVKEAYNDDTPVNLFVDAHENFSK